MLLGMNLTGGIRYSLCNFVLMQLAYNETSEGTLGPFNVEAKLTSVGGSVLYANGSGRVSPIALNCA